MRSADVYVQQNLAGRLDQLDKTHYRFTYLPDYAGEPVSLTMPVQTRVFEFNEFPPFFEGLLPEGQLLEVILRKFKLDRQDYFAQLLQVGQDVVGAVSIKEQK
jgi:serine/threonine-protein kinase HipA